LWGLARRGRACSRRATSARTGRGRAAAAGQPQAADRLAAAAAERGDAEAAIRWWKKAVEGGDRGAATKLGGLLFAVGLVEQAEGWWETAAQAGDDDAAAALASLRGDRGDRDGVRQAVVQAAASGGEQANRILRLLDIDADLVRRRAERGHPQAIRDLIHIASLRGDKDEARRWLTALAELGDLDAVTTASRLALQAGDDDAAERWLRVAAERRRWPDAARRLAELHRRRPAALRADRQRARPLGHGALHDRHVPARLHLRACPPARPACEVHGYHKQGAAYGYTHTLGYHPLLASRADTGEVLHARQRTGRANTARGTARFVDELAARVRRAGASGELTMRMDSGFWSAKTIRACRRHQIRYSVTVRLTKPIRAAIATIDEQVWIDIVYPDGGLAQVAETRHHGDRLIVRRTRLVGTQAELFPNWRYHAFVTDRVDTTVWLDQDHRRHATVELCIRDLKGGVGLRHCPSGRFAANAAWLLAATLAHNLLRWIAAIGLGARGELVVAKTLRRTLLALPGRITHSARRWTLHLPVGWPWAAWFALALARLRCVAHAT